MDLDAYTTTNRYPYGETAETGALADGSGLDHGFNYVRNSVKAVVDAYDGTVDFYVMPVDDPIIEAYRDAFPDLFTDFEEMPDDLQDHLRYPEDLFRVQTNMWARYHVEEPGSFYEGNDYWDVARDPGTAGAGEGTSVTNAARARPSPPATPASTRTTCSPSSRAPIEPEFILLRPFVPTSKQDDSQLLTAFMVGKSDGDDYGKLQVFVMPRGNLPDGPAIVQGNIQSDAEVSRAGDAAVRQRVRRVSFGSLTAIPIDGGLVYVRPFYVTSERDRDPRPRAGDRLLRGRGGHPAHPRGGARRRSSASRHPPSRSLGRARRARGAEPTARGHGHRAGPGRSSSRRRTLFDEAEAALREGDLGTYDEKTELSRDLTRPGPAAARRRRGRHRGHHHDHHGRRLRLTAAVRGRMPAMVDLERRALLVGAAATVAALRLGASALAAPARRAPAAR